MNPLGLSPEALALRRKHVQAGDAARIMAGEWRAVWREKMGLVEPDDLSNVLAVQMGLFTEPFNLAWCEKQTGRMIEYFSDSVLMHQIWYALTGHDELIKEHQVSARYPWMAANLDGLTTTTQGYHCVIDAKHVGRADDPMVLRYTAAGTHQATVMECDWWALSVFVGNSRWELIEQEVDPLYQAELIAATKEFWRFVEDEIEPEDRPPPGLPPKPQPKLRVVQLEDQWRDEWPNWGPEMVRLFEDAAGTYPAWAKHNITKDEMRKLMPGDVGLVRRGLVSLTRDKASAIRWSIKKAKDNGETR